MKTIISFTLLISFCLLPLNAQTKRGFLPEDLYQLKDVADANISPDGSRVAYTVTEVSADHARNVTHIWIVKTEGGEPQRLTKDDADENTPRWSPDGKLLAYYSQDALWIINLDGGKSVHLPDGNWVKTPSAESQKITRVAHTNFFFTKAGESFTWSPDSKQIAFASDPIILPPNPMMERLTRGLSQEELMHLPADTRNTILKAQGKSAEQITAMEAEYKVQQAKANNYTTDVKVVTRLQYKSRTSFSDNLQSHIFIVDVATKQLRQLTSGNYAEHSINWSPKGDEIVFVSNHEPDPDKINNSDLFVANVTTGAVRQLTKTKGCEWQPVFSPDGSQIAYLATVRDVTTIDSVAENAKAFIINSFGGMPKTISTESSRITKLQWNQSEPDFLQSWRGSSEIVPGRENPASSVSSLFTSGPNAQIVGYSFKPQLREHSLKKENHFHLIAKDVHPQEIYKLGIQTKDKKSPLFFWDTITNVNKQLTDKLSFSSMLEYEIDNEGLYIQGWLVPPINLDETKKYPVILYIHGGPHGMHGYSFNATVQALAAKGYGVLLINPRGSSGYGQKFSDGCVNDWGGGDYRDLMKGVDVALEKFPYLDKDRMGVMGGSYGGYMTNWIVTQTDRFKAAIASASLSNLISFYSTSLYQDLVHAEFGGMPWDNYEKLWERSPLKHIKNVKTPTMLVHGENDNDVHITQAEEMYTALKMRGVDTVLVRYPREGHGIREPKHRVDNLQRNLDWFEKYLK